MTSSWPADGKMAYSIIPVLVELISGLSEQLAGFWRGSVSKYSAALRPRQILFYEWPVRGREAMASVRHVALMAEKYLMNTPCITPAAWLISCELENYQKRRRTGYLIIGAGRYLSNTDEEPLMK